jgi:UDP-N-acetylmuramate--alanine ligase
MIQPDSHIHIIGIGGAGMSAIARVLLERGIKVSGSDRQQNELTEALQRDSATVYLGHDARNIDGATALFVTSAAKADNPEIAAAQTAGLPILTRREFFKYLLPDKHQIAVAGTHGKTTTTAIVAHVLRELGKDPSYIIGGILHSSGTNAHAGTGDAFVVEADEYGGMFLGLSPRIAIITNIEHDHPDIFPTLDDVMHTFREFVSLMPDDGLLIACADDANASIIADERRAQGKPVITYGFTGDWRVTKSSPAVITLAQQDSRLSDYVILSPENAILSTVTRVISPMMGDHNMLNSLAALLAVQALGIPLSQSAPTLASFSGTGRRFELMGEAAGVTVLSDYAHHPTAIKATLQATRQRYPQSHIWAVWQPHTYSRTRLLADQFVQSFGDADHVVITDIYAAREQAAPTDPTAAQLAEQTTAIGHPDARFGGTLENSAQMLIDSVKAGDVVIIFSAGDAPKIGEMLLAALQMKHSG